MLSHLTSYPSVIKDSQVGARDRFVREGQVTIINRHEGQRRTPKKYLVIGSGGPGFSSPEEAIKVLEEIVLPSFD
jgi:hypothetical protein